MIIAVFFGSFNPIHNGHVSIAERFLGEEEIDQVWLSVSPQNPWKEADGMMQMEDRVAMCHLATQHIENVRVVDFEKDLDQPSYTYEALNSLKLRYPEHEFILIIGGDNYKSFYLWRNAELIKKDFRVWAYPRYNDRMTKVAGIRMLKAPLLEVSSTEVRSHISDEKELDVMVSPKVKDYLQQL